MWREVQILSPQSEGRPEVLPPAPKPQYVSPCVAPPRPPVSS